MNNIRNIRLSKGITMKELHNRTGIPLRTLEDWEHDKAIPTQYHRLKKLAEVLNCSIEDLMIRKEDAFMGNGIVTVELETAEKGTILRVFHADGYAVINEVITEESGKNLVNYLKKDKDITEFLNRYIDFAEDKS